MYLEVWPQAHKLGYAFARGTATETAHGMRATAAQLTLQGLLRAGALTDGVSLIPDLEFFEQLQS